MSIIADIVSQPYLLARGFWGREFKDDPVQDAPPSGGANPIPPTSPGGGSGQYNPYMNVSPGGTMYIGGAPGGNEWGTQNSPGPQYGVHQYTPVENRGVFQTGQNVPAQGPSPLVPGTNGRSW